MLAPQPGGRAHVEALPAERIQDGTATTESSTQRDAPRPVGFRLGLGELSLCELRRDVIAVSGDPFQSEASRASDETPPIPLPELPDDADGCLLRSLPIRSRLARVAVRSKWIRYVPRQYTRYFADLTTSWDDYMANFSAKSRSTLRRKVRKFEKESGGEIRWTSYTSPEELLEFHRMARGISASTYQERLFDQGLPDDEEFLEEMREAAEPGEALGYIIFLGETAIAYLYCGVVSGVVGYNYLGYLPEFSRWSPGTVLLYLVMQELYEKRSYRIFDFTEGGDRGTPSQKQLFSTSSVVCADVYWFKPTIGNSLVVMLQTSFDWVSEEIGSLLERAGVKNRVRKWIRRRG
jgi:hypothetical protein